LYKKGFIADKIDFLFRIYQYLYGKNNCLLRFFLKIGNKLFIGPQNK